MDENKKGEKNNKKCSHCGEKGHNKRSCPNIKIEDIRYIEENININNKRNLLIKNLIQREEYEIKPDIFKLWFSYNRPCQLKEVKYILDRNLNKDSIQLYFEMIHDFNI